MEEVSFEQGIDGWKDSRHKIKGKGTRKRGTYSVIICLPHYSFHSLRIKTICFIFVFLMVLCNRSLSIKGAQ